MIVAGKGGVGKTTLSATTARLATRVGLRVLIVEMDAKSDLPALFGRNETLGYEPTELAPGVQACVLTPDDALVEYLEDHGLRRILKRLSSSGALDVVATAVPGIKDILVLGKVKQLERSGAHGADLIVVDAPAAGHAVTFLASARSLLDTANVGPIRTQAADVIELLSDPARCRVLLVTLPEETPVNELIDTAYLVEERAGVTLTPVVVNGLWPRLDLPRDPSKELAAAGLDLATSGRIADAVDFRLRRQDLEAEQTARLAERLPLPQLRLPYLFTTDLGLAEVDRLADALAEGIATLEPAESAS
ncbi:MAG: ArsA family ATPase [Acidimicrobiaceae bacterium]|nr:ArsA family ATPase [Acidimicrobiaceae bacterium]